MNLFTFLRPRPICSNLFKCNVSTGGGCHNNICFVATVKEGLIFSASPASSATATGINGKYGTYCVEMMSLLTSNDIRLF